MTKSTIDLTVGERFSDKAGHIWEVTEIRRDPFAETARWIVVRVRGISKPGDEGELACTAAERFTIVGKPEVAVQS